MDGDQRPEGRLAALDLLAGERLGDEVEAGAAVLLRDDDPEDAELGHALDQLQVELVVDVVLDRDRQHALVHEGADGVLDQPLLVGELEVHAASLLPPGAGHGQVCGLGKSYLVMVGRRPNGADAAFTLTARLFLPPPNDAVRQAKRIPHLPAKVAGSTFGATTDDVDPEGCNLGGGTVWFALPKVASERIAVRLTALGDLDASVTVVQRIRSQGRARRMQGDRPQGHCCARGRPRSRRDVRDRGRPAGRVAAGHVRPRRAGRPAGRARAGTVSRRRPSDLHPQRAHGRERHLVGEPSRRPDLPDRAELEGLSDAALQRQDR